MSKLSTWARFKKAPIDNPVKTMIITVLICFVASLFVTFSAIKLRPIQKTNTLNDKRKNILQVAGIYEEGKTIDEMFKNVEARVVDIRTGEYTTSVNSDYNEITGAKDPETSRALTKQEDTAAIRRQSFYKVIYLVKDSSGEFNKIILPIHGYGLWSTLYGFVAIGTDANTIYALKFYSHAETPGLGGEVDNPNWRAQWQGKNLFDDNGKVAIEVVKTGASGKYQIDALSGATITSTGVNNLVRFWVGKNGFGKFLKTTKEQGIQ